MHYLAQREATIIGPRVFNVRGEDRIAYGLNKAEVKRLFMREGYNTTTGSRWRSTLREWRSPDLFRDFLSVDDKTIMNKREDVEWYILFTVLTKSEETYLKMVAEEKDIPAYPREQREAVAVCL